VSDATDPLAAQLSTVRKEAIRLMQALAREGTTYETSAGEISKVADSIEQNGGFGEAEAMRVLARNYRIRVLEVQGQIAALRHQYASLYGDPSCGTATQA
jgi:hypothetical protein